MRRLVSALFLLSLLSFSGSTSIRAAVAPPALPSGERTLGQVTIEPAYNADTGSILYLLTPDHAPFPSKANFHAVSPLYLVVYPKSAQSVGTMNCAHDPMENCPDHGNDIAGLAEFAPFLPQAVRDVYANGVWGHDHIVDPPGAPDFNIAWHVIVVLFTNSNAAKTHLTTDSAIDLAVTAGDAIEVDTPIVFNCSVVAAAPYFRATPVPPINPVPALVQRPRQ